MAGRLQNRVAIMTGGNSEIGEATSRLRSSIWMENLEGGATANCKPKSSVVSAEE